MGNSDGIAAPLDGQTEQERTRQLAAAAAAARNGKREAAKQKGGIQMNVCIPGAKKGN